MDLLTGKLFTAAEQGDVCGGETLIAKGADVNAADGRGERPVHLAAFNDDLGFIEMLLKHGADIKVKNRNGETPRMRAHSLDTIKRILQAEQDGKASPINGAAR